MTTTPQRETVTIKREEISATVTRNGNNFSLKYKGSVIEKTYRLKFNPVSNSFEGDQLSWWWMEAIRLKFELPDSPYRKQIQAST